MTINVKKINNRAMIPTRGSACAAGYDLYAIAKDGMDSISIPAGETVKVNTGIAIAIPDGYFGAIFARSGLATKRGLRPANCVGVVDSDYRGEIIVALHNDTSENDVVEVGDRIAQLVIIPYLDITLSEVDELDDTIRGECGFGSTGTK